MQQATCRPSFHVFLKRCCKHLKIPPKKYIKIQSKTRTNTAAAPSFYSSWAGLKQPKNEESNRSPHLTSKSQVPGPDQQARYARKQTIGKSKEKRDT